jgi:hypothetical protein
VTAQAANLFLLDHSRTRVGRENSRKAIAMHFAPSADWTKTFVATPHTDLGRDGPVCPFVALDHPTLWRNHYTLGVIDRVTGDLSLTQNDKCEDLGRWDKTTFDLHCKPMKPFFQIP